MRIVIQGDAIAKKNSQRVVRFGKGRNTRHSIRASKAYEIWEKQALSQLFGVGEYTGPYPAEMRIFFYRKTKRKFDLSNMLEGTQDVLQKAGVIIDDSMKYIIPVIDKRGSSYGWDIDRDNPRVEVKLVPAFNLNI
jgi:Holliday junction resolvase RusA-like endonuclease